MAYFPASQPLAARYDGCLQPRQQRQMDWFALLQLHEGRQTGHLCVGATRRVAPTTTIYLRKSPKILEYKSLLSPDTW